jgi:hypothetical protein
MGGSPKKSPVIKALEGNPGQRIIEASGIEAMGEPFIHEHLMEDARGCIEVIRQSMPKKVYSTLDSYLLAAFGIAWAIHKMATIKISAPDFVLINPVRMTQSPWLDVLNKQAMIMVSAGARLGLDPASRAGLKLPGARQQKSKFDGLLGQTESLPSSNVSPFHRA